VEGEDWKSRDRGMDSATDSGSRVAPLVVEDGRGRAVVMVVSESRMT